MEKCERGSRNGAVCSFVVTVHDACVHAESTPLCCQGQNQCCNLVKCSYPSIRLKGVQFYQVFIWGIAKAQRTSDDVKLSEPGGGSDLPGAVTGNLSHFPESGKRFRACNGNFEVGLRGFQKLGFAESRAN